VYVISYVVSTTEAIYCRMRWDEDRECCVGTDLEGNGSVLFKFIQHASGESEKKLRINRVIPKVRSPMFKNIK
jgi:hypothetical protein